MLNLLQSTKSRKGFTLIELLVVIAIIGVLSSVVLASLSSARANARDARRKADLQQIQIALEMVYNDHGTYMLPSVSSNADPWWFINDCEDRVCVGEALVDNGYLSAPIMQPGNGGNYLIDVGSEHYTVWAYLEDPSTEDTSTLSSCYFSTYDGHGSDPDYCVSN